jgi:hypothetical protein
VIRQLQVARYAFESTSGDERAQGSEAFRGDRFGPGPPQPLPSWLLADQSSHLWRLPLPADLEPGALTAKVTGRHPDGRTYSQMLVFEVVEERPAMAFRTEVFEEQSAGG